MFDEFGNPIEAQPNTEYDSQEQEESFEVKVESVDRRDLTEPTIAAGIPYSFHKLSDVPDSFVLPSPDSRVISIGVYGSLGTGKTTLCDSIAKRHYKTPTHFCDNRNDEIDREISLSSSPFLVEVSSGLFASFWDTPGHPDFRTQALAMSKYFDYCIVLVDSLMGMLEDTRIVLTEILKERKGREETVIVCVSKFDRYIVEASIPPLDAYFKLKSIVSKTTEVHPKLKHLWISCGMDGWAFSIQSFFESVYGESVAQGVSLFFAEGDPLLDYLVQPVYTLYSNIIGLDYPELLEFVQNQLGLTSRYRQLPSLLKFKTPRELTREILGQYLSYKETLFTHLDPIRKDTSGQAVVKIIDIREGVSGSFSMVRPVGLVIQGTITRKDIGTEFSVVSEGGNTFKSLLRRFSIANSSFSAPAKTAVPGMILEFDDVPCEMFDYFVFGEFRTEVLEFENLEFSGLLEVGLLPFYFKDKKRLKKALKVLSRIYAPLKYSRLDSTGEYTISGPGELFFDVVINLIRNVVYFSEELKVRVSAPRVRFREGIRGTTSHVVSLEGFKLFCTPNYPDAVKSSDYLKFLDSRTISKCGDSNLLVNGDFETDPSGINLRKMVEAFKSVCKSSYLIRQPLMNAMFIIVRNQTETDRKKLNVIEYRDLMYEAIQHSKPIIFEPWVRVEIVLGLSAAKDIEKRMAIREEHLERLRTLIISRRGVFQTGFRGIGGTNLMRAYVKFPLLDTLGLEIDIQVITDGMAWCNGVSSSLFSDWGIVPGNPLDDTIDVTEKRVYKDHELAREVRIKVGKLKGIL